MKSLLLLSILYIIYYTNAWTYIPVSDFNMVKSSDCVVYGTVTEQLLESPVDVNKTHQYYNINVEQTLFDKSSRFSNSIIVRTLGGYNRYTDVIAHFPGSPSLSIGDKVLLFLIEHSTAIGIYDIQHFGLGAFHEILSEGASLQYNTDSYAYRISDLQEYSETLKVRKMSDFIAWISQVGLALNHGRIRDQLPNSDYWTTLSTSEFQSIDNTRLGLHIRYNTMSTNGYQVRWGAFDSGNAVSWYSDPNGTPNLNGNGVTEIKQAIAAWNEATPDTTIINYSYAGTSTAVGGLSTADGVNDLVYEDPQNDIPGAYDCSTGGTLALGGWKSKGRSLSWRGMSWVQIEEGDIVVQNGIGCWISARPSTASLNWANMLTHEFGHTLGMGHSCGDTKTGTCVSGSAADKAVMRAYLQTGLGPVLQTDDMNGIKFLYASCWPNDCSATPDTSTATGTGKYIFLYRFDVELSAFDVTQANQGFCTVLGVSSAICLDEYFANQKTWSGSTYYQFQLSGPLASYENTLKSASDDTVSKATGYNVLSSSESVADTNTGAKIFGYPMKWTGIGIIVGIVGGGLCLVGGCVACLTRAGRKRRVELHYRRDSSASAATQEAYDPNTEVMVEIGSPKVLYPPPAYTYPPSYSQSPHTSPTTSRRS